MKLIALVFCAVVAASAIAVGFLGRTDDPFLGIVCGVALFASIKFAYDRITSKGDNNGD